MQAGIEQIQPGQLQLTGDVNFNTAASLKLAGEKLLSNSQTAQIDLTKIEHYDSSIISLLLSWLRFAKKNKIQLNFIGLPQRLLTMIRINNVEKLLRVENHG